MNRTRLRPWVAAILAFVYPGLGHVYLRLWLRALAWFALSMLTTALVLPESAVTAFETGGFAAMSEAIRSLGLATLAPVFLVQFLNIVDAYVAANRRDVVPDHEQAATCPECGRELDDDLDFCPWCTTRLDAPEDAGDPTSR
ncbi:zinc ribbon domain-containing protein [Halobacteriaceae archaeon GCM10025711]